MSRRAPHCIITIFTKAPVSRGINIISRPPQMSRRAPSLHNRKLHKSVGVTRHNHDFPSTVNAASRPSLHNRKLHKTAGVTRHKKSSRPPQMPRHAPSLHNHNLHKIAGVTRHNHNFTSTSGVTRHNHNLLLSAGVTRHKHNLPSTAGAITRATNVVSRLLVFQSMGHQVYRPDFLATRDHFLLGDQVLDVLKIRGG